MEKTKKIKRAAFVLFVAVCLILLYNAVLVSWAGFGIQPVPVGAILNPVRIALDVVRVLIVLAILVCAMTVLLSIKKAETPFNTQNIRLLKTIAILLAVIDPYEIIVSRIPYFFVEEGPTVVLSSWPSGCFFVAGIVVFCISLVFEYGMTLQQQFDETL
ncbi:MAG: DUF2975 domain-containing protein [Clostridia bacterium]|nr:DUF2975 domain-containing protein [Clostridia bacterium]